VARPRKLRSKKESNRIESIQFVSFRVVSCRVVSFVLVSGVSYTYTIPCCTVLYQRTRPLPTNETERNGTRCRTDGCDAMRCDAMRSIAVYRARTIVEPARLDPLPEPFPGSLVVGSPRRAVPSRSVPFPCIAMVRTMRRQTATRRAAPTSQPGTSDEDERATQKVDAARYGTVLPPSTHHRAHTLARRAIPVRTLHS